MVACGALPQLWGTAARRGSEAAVFFRQGVLLPWAAAAHLAWEQVGVALAILCTATAAAYAFRPFSNSAAACASTSRPRVRGFGRKRALDRPALQLARGSLFRSFGGPGREGAQDHGRSPRFRVVFLMGFSFGAIIWWR